MRTTASSLTAVIVAALVGAASTDGADFAIGLGSFDEATLAGSSVYYSNNNVTDAGNFLVGQISYGPREISHVDGSAVNGYHNTNGSAKSAVQLGNYIFASHHDAGGVMRLDAATWTNMVGFVSLTNATGSGTGAEALCTDGTHLFGNDDHNRNEIHAWAISNVATGFTARLEWTAALPAGRVRGFSFANGYLYACANGAASDRRIYAIRVSDQEVVDMGVDVPGTDLGYGIIRSGEILMALTRSAVYVWDMTSDTSVDGASKDTYSQTDLTGGVNSMYSLSHRDGRLLVGWVGHTRVFDTRNPPSRATVISIR